MKVRTQKKIEFFFIYVLYNMIFFKTKKNVFFSFNFFWDFFQKKNKKEKKENVFEKANNEKQ